MKKKWDTIRASIIEWFRDVWALIKENRRITIVVMAFVVVIAVAIALSSAAAKKSKNIEAVLTEETVEDTEYPIPEEPLEVDAYPEVNELMKKYYQAEAEGDVSTIESIKSSVDDKEKIVIQKKSEYIENYPVVTCYTKKGPVEDSYLVFAYYEVKLKDYEETAPGLNAWYVYRNQSGNLFIDDDEQDEKISNYCKIVSVQDDVVDLNNTVNVKFNDLLAENDDMASFLEELPDNLMAAVGEELAKAEIPETETVEEETVQESTEEVAEVVKKVKATTVVNVRASDSETADKLGKAMEGEEYTLLEEKVNGWSKIEFEGQEAFIKTEFLEVVSEKTVEKSNEDAGNDNDQADDTDDAEAAKDSPTSGKAMAKETIKLRKSASTSADTLELIYAGAKVEVVNKQADGWSKVKYEGKTGFVKSEYLE